MSPECQMPCKCQSARQCSLAGHCIVQCPTTQGAVPAETMTEAWRGTAICDQRFLKPQQARCVWLTLHSTVIERCSTVVSTPGCRPVSRLECIHAPAAFEWTWDPLRQLAFLCAAAAACLGRRVAPRTRLYHELRVSPRGRACRCTSPALSVTC